MTPEERFVRSSGRHVGSKAYSRSDIKEKIGGRPIPVSAPERSPGDFLARLWSRFGPSDESDGGFSYRIDDKATGLSFRAYSGASGPAYGGDKKDSRLLPALLAFEAWISASPLAPCEIEYMRDEGTVRCGAKDGTVFNELLPLPPPVPSAFDASTPEDCLRIAEALGYGEAIQGFMRALEDVLVFPLLQGKFKDQFEGLKLLTYDSGSRRLDAYFELPDGAPKRVPLLSLPLPELEGKAALWLQAYREWLERPDGAEPSY